MHLQLCECVCAPHVFVSIQFGVCGRVCLHECLSAGPDSIWLTLEAQQRCESRLVKDKAGKAPERHTGPYSGPMVGSIFFPASGPWQRISHLTPDKEEAVVSLESTCFIWLLWMRIHTHTHTHTDKRRR